MSPIPVQVLAVPAATAVQAVPADAATAGEQDAGADFKAVLAGRIADVDGEAPASDPGMAPLLIDGAEALAEVPADAAGADASVLFALIAAQVGALPAVPKGEPNAIDVESQSAGSASPSGTGPALTATEARTHTAGNAPAATPTLLPPDAPVSLTAATQRREPLPAQASGMKEEHPVAAPLRQSDLPPAVPAAGMNAPVEAAALRAGSTAEPLAHAGAEASTFPGAETTPVGPSTQSGRQGAAADATPSLRLETPVTAPRWGEEMTQKLVWLAGRNESRAELVLTPPQMGKVEVTLTVSQSGETSALFVSPNPQVREALEQSLARLREVFAAAGISLGQTSVSGDSPARDQRGETRSGGRHRIDTIATAALPAGPPASRHRGLVDTFV
jgi:flagellar hook-length control protein FliK